MVTHDSDDAVRGWGRWRPVLGVASAVAVICVVMYVAFGHPPAPAPPGAPATSGAPAPAAIEPSAAGPGAPSPSEAAPRQTPKINPTGYTSARVCGSCHVDIYNSWKNSLHAFSLTDPVFDTAYMQAIKDGGDEAKRLCLRCHAPLTQFTHDYDLREGTTREGVSCDFCHTLTAVHLDRPDHPFSAQPGLVKRSVLRHASSPVHKVEYSPLHETAELCGGCHNYVSPAGAEVMSTYDEWRSGPYAAEGKPCQSCHMVRRAGNVVAPEVQKTSVQGIHLHNLIHDTDQLKSAVTVRVASCTRTADEIEVEVVVENVGSGHKVPTGVPSRELVLTVGMQAGDKTWTQERRYRKVVADAEGRVLPRDYEAMLRGARIVSDNRIAPREQRHERFSFAPSGSGTVEVWATVSYVYSPFVLAQREINIELARAQRFLP